MKSTRLHRSLSLAVLFGSLVAAQSLATKRPPESRAASPAGTTTTSAPIVEPAARVVQYGDRDIVKLKAKVGFTTLIVLPKNESILDFTTGDRDLWIVNGNANFAHIKPAKEASRTNLNLITASGNIYSFVLTEISGSAEAAPDLKVFVEPKEESMEARAAGSPRFVPIQELDNYKQQVVIAKEETRQVKDSAQAEIDRSVSKFLASVRFP